MARRLISSGGPWEGTVGYSRAVVVGDTCTVAGTADAGPDGQSAHPGDAGAQARAVFAIIGAALAEARFGFDDVMRTRIFVTDIAFAPDVLAAHGEVFHDIRPAATIVAVTALLDPTLLVEIEVDARKSG
jgi:enamine deaminase RidA (YjgF/YER057c/UK114 family)